MARYMDKQIENGPQEERALYNGSVCSHGPVISGQSLAAIESCLDELLTSPDQRPLMSLPVRCQLENGKSAQSLDFIGVGDEIRTHDPNLGK